MNRILIGAVASVLIAAGAPAGPAVAQTAASLPPATAWAREPAIASVDVSPDGRHVVAVISPDGRQRVVAIWKTAAMNEAPFIVGSDDERAEVVGAQFIKNDRIFVTTQQLRDFNPFTGQRERSFLQRTQVLTLEGRPARSSLTFDGLDETQQAIVGVGRLISDLPRDPENIIIADPRRGDKYRLNLYTGRAERIERGSERFGGEQADLNGEIRAKTEFDFDNGAAYIAQWIKHPDSGEWAEHFRYYARDRQPVSIVGFSNDPNVVFVSKTEGRDRAAIYEYRIREREFGEIAFAHPLFEAGGVVRSRAPANFGEIVGFTYEGERGRTYFTDPVLDQAFTDLRRATGVTTVPVDWVDIETGERSRFTVGDGADISLVATSDDRSEIIISKSGPTTPTEYYILIDGRVRLLGRAYPELREAPLGETTLIQYAARDGLMIPAFLTKPDPEVYGPGPYPTIITPHGGPWSRDSLSWDTTGWTQYFATRGFAVLQPQFRGSEGWGQRLWRAGDREWGRKMQDDNDDGVRHLVAEGVADPGRVAMHGYSYGGYASMMAAVRPNGLYQCAVAGAGPATIALFKKGTYNNRFLREFQHPTADGEDPLRRVGEVSIPLYLYTGDRDTRVLPSESETMAAALRNAGKPVKLTILPDMEHTINTWNPTNFANVLTSVEDFLRNDCGPGGI
ncbi:alpha/beta hydrolase family protein [Brevundimonas sp.]|uniref:alpha/beta hydrolase family protein n=1 Tax=Brevundimonas sp. TaxID=1871086 RepID=UPI002D34717A|nr:prolyl oligopeptidase family serine peptidase [Brevundimonas sp.]HYC96452.1 prolyl oligopeptidase family serine peptidase [Brevundimonas sp.]